MEYGGVNMITIKLINSQIISFPTGDYIGYECNKDCFTVIVNEYWHQMFYMKDVVSIYIENDERIIAVDDRTKLGWPLPNVNNEMKIDVERIRETFNLIDKCISEILKKLPS